MPTYTVTFTTESEELGNSVMRLVDKYVEMASGVPITITRVEES